jgi:hypothetical protein
MKTVRNGLCILLATMSLGSLGACGSTNGPKSSYTGTWWRQNLRGYWWVLRRDATDFYRSVDRHFFNYDWDDPALQH